MADKQQKSLIHRVREGAAGLAMASALATGGCSPSAPQTTKARDEVQAPQTVPMPNMAPAPEEETLPVIPPEMSRYLDLGPQGRLRIDLVLGDRRLPMLVDDVHGDAQERFNAAIAEALEHPERYATVSLEISDAANELPVCTTRLDIPPEERTREGLSGRVELLTHQPIVLREAMRCSLQLPNQPSAPESPAPEPWEPPAGELQPLGPLQMASDTRRLDGRIAETIARDL